MAFPDSDTSQVTPESDYSSYYCYDSDTSQDDHDISFYWPESDTSQFNATPLSMPSNVGGGDKSYVAIFFPTHCDHLLIRVSVDSLLEKNNLLSMTSSSHDPEEQYKLMPRRDPSELSKDFTDLLPTGSIHYASMHAICTSTVGALGPCIFLFRSSKEVWRYDLHQPHTGSNNCANMVSAINDALSVQIGDFFYVLSFAGANRPILQKYDIENDIWTLVQDNIITKCNYKDWYNLSMPALPHVVIDRKLHVSFSYNSFAFDTEKDTWEYSNLFETFWFDHNKINFYGAHVWAMHDSDLKCFDQPFGFYKRGIVWDEDILLGLHYSSECQLVAFQLLDNKAVKSQSFTFAHHKYAAVQLLELGQGYFSILLNTTPGRRGHQLELVTILLSKPREQQVDCFLECQIVRKDCVAENFDYSVGYSSTAYCV